MKNKVWKIFKKIKFFAKSLINELISSIVMGVEYLIPPSIWLDSQRLSLLMKHKVLWYAKHQWNSNLINSQQSFLLYIYNACHL